MGVRLGISLALSPANWPALMAYWDRMLAADGPIHPTQTARRLAPLILRPPIPLLPGSVVDLLALPGLALLPARLRDEFGIDWGERHERAARTLGWGVRAWVRTVPAGLRSMPHANRAFARAARHDP